MKKKEFSTAAILSLTTGRLLCQFSEMHELAEYLAGGPVWTHQFAHEPFNTELREAIWAQHPQLRRVTGGNVTTKNWMSRLQEWIREFGSQLSLIPMADVKTAKDAFVKPLSRSGSTRSISRGTAATGSVPPSLPVSESTRVEAPARAQLDPNRCAVCGWPLDPEGKMCVRGNCSMRPLPCRPYDPVRAQAEYGSYAPKEWTTFAALDARAASGVSGAVSELSACTCQWRDGALGWNPQCAIHTPEQFRGMIFREGIKSASPKDETP